MKYTHITCGYCNRANILRCRPHAVRGGLPICENCEQEFKAIFQKPLDNAK